MPYNCPFPDSYLLVSLTILPYCHLNLTPRVLIDALGRPLRCSNVRCIWIWETSQIDTASSAQILHTYIIKNPFSLYGLTLIPTGISNYIPLVWYNPIIIKVILHCCSFKKMNVNVDISWSMEKGIRARARNNQLRLVFYWTKLLCKSTNSNIIGIDTRVSARVQVIGTKQIEKCLAM